MLNIKSLSKVYIHNNKKIEILRNINLKINKGEFVVIVGPSGCGKTTLLKCIAGLTSYSQGSIDFKNKNINLGMIFQNFSSFPWLTVKENIEFGLNINQIDSKKRDKIVNHYLITTGLKDYAHFYPKNLSGGMKQRVVLAMVLANNPQIVLMDEPFGSLDSQTKSLMQELLLNIWNKDQKTILFVTHDIEEAIFLADRIYVMGTKPGEIKEEIKVNIPRPRNAEIKLSNKFLDIKKRIHYIIRGESIKAAQFRFYTFNRKTIKIGLHTWAGITPFYYALDEGYFSKTGLNIELINLEKDDDRIRAFKNKEIDLLHLTVDAIYYLRNIKHINCNIAMLLDDSIGGDALIASNSINSIKQLRGKKIGVEKNLFSHFFLAYLLNKNKLNINDVKIVFLKSSDIGTYFLNNKIDAAILWEPWLSGVLRITKTKILASTAQERNKIISVLFARNDFINNHKKELHIIQDIWDKITINLERDLSSFTSKLAPYIGLSSDDFNLQINKLKFIHKNNRNKYNEIVKQLIKDSKFIWKLIINN